MCTDVGRFVGVVGDTEYQDLYIAALLSPLHFFDHMGEVMRMRWTQYSRGHFEFTFFFREDRNRDGKSMHVVDCYGRARAHISPVV